jgi:kynurenine formamidase
MITYKGLPAPSSDLSGRNPQTLCGRTEFNIGKIEMVANTGTYVDSPFHRLQMAWIWQSRWNHWQTWRV